MKIKKVRINWGEGYKFLYAFVGIFVFISCINLATTTGIKYIIKFDNPESTWQMIFNIGLWGMVALWSVDNIIDGLRPIKITYEKPKRKS